MKRALPALTALLILATAGLAHGLWTGRWVESRVLEDAAARLDRLPLTLGDWEGTDLPVTARMKHAADVAGMIMRRYTNRRTGQTVSVLLLCGRAGPLSVHTPDICYAGSGYTMSTPEQRNIEGEPSPTAPRNCWRAVLTKGRRPIATTLRLYWSWWDARGWQAPEHPRFAFAGDPVLYKLYVQREEAGDAPGRDDDACVALLRELVPALNATVLPSSPPTASP